MLYNFNGTLLKQTLLLSKGQRSEYPFVLTVAMRNGQQFAVRQRKLAAYGKFMRSHEPLTALWSAPSPTTRLSIVVYQEGEPMKKEKEAENG